MTEALREALKELRAIGEDEWGHFPEETNGRKWLAIIDRALEANGAPEPGTEPPAMHLASVIETVADLLERSGNAKLGASLLRDGLKERKRRDQVAPEPLRRAQDAIRAVLHDVRTSTEGLKYETLEACIAALHQSETPPSAGIGEPAK